MLWGEVGEEMTEQELIARLLDWEEHDEGKNNDAREAATNRIEELVEERDTARRLLGAATQMQTETQAKLTNAVEAMKALHEDMLERSRAGMDTIHGKEYRIVNAGRTAWTDFCAVLAELEGK